MHGSPYYSSPTVERVGVLAPPIIITLVVLIAYGDSSVVTQKDLPVWMWLLCIVGIDVAHVWSTLFRTYLDPVARKKFQVPLYLTPICCWIAGVLLYAIGATLFWSVFAYLAVFHFVRQQYGIYALYGRSVQYSSNWWRILDTATVYLGALYPLLYWHAHIPRAFYWFIEGDFVFRIPKIWATFAGILLTVALSLQVLHEILLVSSAGRSRLPKNLVIWGTVLSWYVGIVHYNADIPFTLTNVVAHGVPYLTLIWVFARKQYLRSSDEFPFGSNKKDDSTTPTLQHKRIAIHQMVFSSKGVGRVILSGFCCILGVSALAFIEEALWDTFIWRDHGTLFNWLWRQLPVVESKEILLLLVPLLAVPQATHYVLDGFIWRFRKHPSNFTDSGEPVTTV